MNEFGFENASQRKSFVGVLFDKGEKYYKNEVLDNLPSEWAELHRSGKIHIHDLEAYGLTYNCLTFNLLNKFPYKRFEGKSDIRKIIGIFDYLKDIIAKIGNEQSGGMSFANFDNDLSIIFNELNIEENEANYALLKECIGTFIHWCNNARERLGQVSYYVSLNIGLSTQILGNRICEYVLDEFENAGTDVFKPNIIFKVKDGVNIKKVDPNYYLYEKACLCTAKKMIPTYLLCDSITNKSFNPFDIAIMGCRTRVLQNNHGKPTSVGRGNIDYITINLPHIALEIEAENNEDNLNTKVERFIEKWKNTASIVKDILIDRNNKLLMLSKTDFPTNLKYDLWIEDFSTAENLDTIFKNGTFSIGFIGLSEVIEIFSGKKYYLDDALYQKAIYIIKSMRNYIDTLRRTYDMNFTLLATSGEFISGRFPNLDKIKFKHKVLDKNFYTNSFHIDVDSNLSASDKIAKEGVFHEFCNGGAITYVELKSSPIGNSEGLQELIEIGIENGTSYLGFNFPLDVCENCGEKGVFDYCPSCGSDKIKRIRRVSGYLEILDFFTQGKKAEVKYRKKNID
jgi:anaerobic ribonucleoside-triphosphate reductase